MTARPSAATGPIRRAVGEAAPAVLSVKDLQIQFRSAATTVYAVNGVSLEICAGEVVGLIGETGSGKSTVARSLLNLLPASAAVVGGSVEIHAYGGVLEPLAMRGQELRKLRGSVVSYVPQSTAGAFNPVVRIGRQFETMIRNHRHLSRRDCHELAAGLLAKTGIHDPERVLRGYAHELSGGMAQRVAMAMALILNPALVVADEPTTGLDLTVQRQILDLIRDLVAANDASLLLVTHDMGVVAQYCDRVAVMYGGFLVEVGAVAEVFSHPAHPYTRALLGAAPRRGEPLRVLPGSVGPLMHLPSGCPFLERCPIRADPRCETARPPMRAVGPSHQAATFCELVAD